MSKRVRYFLGHLAVSFILACLVTVLVTLFWYPAPLFKAAGLAKIFFMLLAIDVLIGPFFSLLVYKEGKKTLKFDLSVIVLIQFCAFAYGFYSIAEGRPAWIAFNKDRFELIRLNEIDDREINKALPEYQTASWMEPKWVKVALERESVEVQNQVLLEEGMSGGMYSVAQSPRFYRSIENADSMAWMQKAHPVTVLKKYNDKQKVDAVLGRFAEADYYLPLKSKGYDMAVLINSKDPTWKQIVDLRPW
ncbi:TfpX/TfpZ family type IV pilin accessory protein [Neisseria zoodegmatis]|uniref:Fimbrial assembly protein n=1 Tax=Neisseria zoodegmatis TaxID=326523 RepID=A0AB38DPF9_9NEIS|nr:TfpX/TfpZ family type IV pilin accessory protein [Neisseria zoodegmatis]OSI10439.1 hypothetical protein BWD10_05130 [Neisseria zoodegmatis]SNU79136.1 putative fimbrial assembly protein [Neisseria zoodegmatis]